MKGKLGFIGNFLSVEADKSAGALMTLLVKWDPSGATEADKRMIAKKLSEFCIKCEEAKIKMQKEATDVVNAKKQYADKLQLAKNWNAEIENPATDAARKALLEQKLPGLMQELQEFGPKIDKEVREAEVAKKVFDTYDQVVNATNQKLQQKIDQGNQAATDLELAQAEQALAEDEVNAVRVLKGLQTATDSFDVAAGVIAKQADKIRTETAAMRREADLLAAGTHEDDFMAAELAKVKGEGDHAKPIADQFAELEAKLK